MTVRERSGGAPLPGALTGKASHELRLTGWPGRHRKGVRSFRAGGSLLVDTPSPPNGTQSFEYANLGRLILASFRYLRCC